MSKKKAELPVQKPRQSPQGQFLKIDCLVPGGQALGRLADGRACFVRGAFAGDEIEVESFQEKKGFVAVDSFRLSKSSPDRVENRCGWARACGGCDWMPLSASAQESAKISIVRQALVRTGKLESALADRVLRFNPAPHQWAYRSRVRLQMRQGQLGYFKAGTHELIEIDRCEVVTPLLQLAMNQVRSAVALEPSAFRAVKYVEVRAWGELAEGPLDPERSSAHFVLHTQPPAKNSEGAVERVRAATLSLRRLLQVRIARETASCQRYDLGSSLWGQAIPGGFTQVNEGVNQQLVRRIVALAQKEGAGSFLDLYCGSGNFSLPLLQAGLRGVGVELSAEAIFAARSAAKDQGLGGSFVANACDVYLRDASHCPGEFDLVMIDPPRSGAKEVLEDILRLAPRTIFMLSCDPVTLARDTKILLEGGASLLSVDIFDMFPQTHHAESLAVFRLKTVS